jgi:TonB-linked SusC/RagA family outer membrane protein
LAASNGATANYSKNAIISYLGRINYTYKDKYLLTASIRRDGSSKFQDDNKYSLFPSAGVAWKLSEESFMKNSNIFDLLKIRASYGLTGSQAISPYSTLSTYLTDPYSATTVFSPGSTTAGIVIGNAANPDLKWETTAAFDIGLDMELLHSRLRFSADYYNKTTRDLLLAQPLPMYLGGGSITSNVGEINNKGWDFALSGTPVNNAAGLLWTSTFNLSFLQNKVVSLGDQEQIFTGTGVGSGLSTQPEFVLKPGNPLGSYWGLKYLGTWKANEATQAALFGAVPGDSKYQDLNGDNSISNLDFQIIGHGLPTVSYGWDNSFSYKGIGLNVFIQSVNGVDKLNYTYGAAITANADARQATLADIKDRYVPGKNENSDIPAFTTSNKNYLQSTRFIERANFIRVKNINLSYDLPKSISKNSTIKLFVGAINLLTITNYKGIDPESSTTSSGSDTVQSIDYGSYPNSKRFFAGLNIKF